MGLNIKSLQKIMSCIDAGEPVRFECTESPSVLNVWVDGVSERVYELKLLDAKQDTIEVPNFKDLVRVSVPLTNLSRVIKDLQNIDAATVTVTMRGDTIAFEAEVLFFEFYGLNFYGLNFYVIF